LIALFGDAETIFFASQARSTTISLSMYGVYYTAEKRWLSVKSNGSQIAPNTDYKNFHAPIWVSGDHDW